MHDDGEGRKHRSFNQELVGGRSEVELATLTLNKSMLRLFLRYSSTKNQLKLMRLTIFR